MVLRSQMISGMLNQKAVYWGTPAYSAAGARTFADPVDLDVRWEDKQKEFRDTNGSEHTSTAVVYCAQEVDLGGYLYLGELSDVDSADQSAPMTLNGAHEIRWVGMVPSVDGKRKLWKVML